MQRDLLSSFWLVCLHRTVGAQGRKSQSTAGSCPSSRPHTTASSGSCWSIHLLADHSRKKSTAMPAHQTEPCFCVSQRRLKILGTTQILSIALPSSEILKPKLIQWQAVSVGEPCLSNLLSSAVIFAINIARKNMSKAWIHHFSWSFRECVPAGVITPLSSSAAVLNIETPAAVQWPA